VVRPTSQAGARNRENAPYNTSSLGISSPISPASRAKNTSTLDGPSLSSKEVSHHMNWKGTIFARCTVALCAAGICAALLAPMAAPAKANQDSQVEKSTKAKRSKKSTAAMNSATETAPVKNASTADIQAAKSNGEVWVNTDSGVYHKSGKWYGTTKNGKFMSEQDAVKSGFRPAKNEK